MTSDATSIGVEGEGGDEEGSGDGVGAGSISGSKVITCARGISSIALGANGASGKTIDRVLFPDSELIVFVAILFELTRSNAVKT